MPHRPVRLEFDRWVFTLELTRRTRFHFHHGGVLPGLLCRALETRDLPEGVIPYACESGRVVFEPGASYRVGVTFVGPARLASLAEDLRTARYRPDALLGLAPPQKDRSSRRCATRPCRTAWTDVSSRSASRR